MNKFEINSAIDAAYWFIQYADKKNFYLDDEKIHQLLFLAQSSYLKKNEQKLLFPSLFVITENGFFEPNLLKIFAFGRPFMPQVSFEKDIQIFLENIYNKYASQPTVSLRNLIINTPFYKNLYAENQKQCVCASQIFSDADNLEKIENKQNKIRLSQNGPVYVSPWKPKKIGK